MSTQAVDYDALAVHYGAVSSPDGEKVDYDALAKQFGGTQTEAPPAVPLPAEAAPGLPRPGVPKPAFMDPRRMEPQEVSLLPESIERGAYEQAFQPPATPLPRATRGGVAAAAINAATNPALGAESGLPQIGTEAVQGARELRTPGKRLGGAAKLVGAAGEVASPIMGPAVLANPVPVAAGLATGTVGSEAAGRVTKAAGGGEGAQELERNLGFWAPTLLGSVAGLRGGGEVSPEGTRAAVTGLGGKVGAGVAVTPEGVTVRSKVGPLEGSKTFSRGAKTAPAPAIEPPTIEGQPIVPGGDAEGTAYRPSRQQRRNLHRASNSQC